MKIEVFNNPPSDMTDEIAFEIGRWNFPSFYSCIRWKINRESCKYYYFFDWSLGWGLPCKDLEGTGKYITDWENIELWGTLKTEKFKKISHKLSFVKGSLQSYAGHINKDRIVFAYANSYDLRDFIAKCLEDVIKDEFLLEKDQGKFGERAFNRNCPEYKIVKDEIIGTMPGTPKTELIADKKILDYFIK